MSKVLKEAPITTRNARSKLAERLHWRAIDPDIHLGYRRGRRAGRWLVRWYKGDQSYGQETFGTADDALDADGKNTLSFDQAVRAARDLVSSYRAREIAEAAGPMMTVRSVTESYADALEARMEAEGRFVSKDARSRFKNHVWESDIADTELYSLKAADIGKWRQKVRAKTSPSTERRISNDLRAALNEAARVRGLSLPGRFTTEVKEGFADGTADRVAISTRPNVVLTDKEVRTFLTSAKEVDLDQGWDGDLFRLVVALAATGARESQLLACKVMDLQIENKRLMVPVSAKGRGVKARSHTPIPIGEDVISELAGAIGSRRANEKLFLRWGSRRAGGLKWERDRRRDWARTDLTDPVIAIVKHAGFSSDVTAYALRHSSIVRGLRAGLSIRQVASLHDTSIQMIERHYAAYIVEALDELAARSVVPLISK